MRPTSNNHLADNSPPKHEAIKLLSLLFSNCSDDTGNINLRYKHPKEKEAHNQFVGVNHIEQIPDIIKRRTNVNWWYGIALRKGYDGTKNGVYLIPAVHLDQDHLTPEKKSEIHSFLKPSAVIQTSSENRQQFLWILKEPAEGKDYAIIEDINRRLINRFEGDPGTQDVSRVLRLPETTNFKYPDHPKCKILELNPECQYSLEDFEVLPKCKAAIDHSDTPVHSERLQRIMQCAFLQHCDRDRASLPEPQWYAMVCVLAKETGGATLIHSLSVCYPKYNRGETDRKIIHAINNSGPITCTRIKELYNCGKNCGVTSPVLLARNPEVSEVKKAHHFNLKTAREIAEMQEPERKWLLDGFIPWAGSALILSKPKVGKTTLEINLAVSAARGENFLGRKMEKCTVVYLGLEMKDSHIKPILRELNATREENLICHCGRAPMQAVNEIRPLLQETNANLLIIDMIQKLARTKDINAYAELSNALEQIIGIAQEEDCTTVISHHIGKSDREDADDAIGSTAFAGGVDTIICIKTLDPEKPLKSRRRYMYTIQRYGDDLEKSILRKLPDGSLELDGPLTEVELSETKIEILAAMHLDTKYKQDEIRTLVPRQRVLICSALTDLHNEGFIKREGKGVRKAPFLYEKVAK